MTDRELDSYAQVLENQIIDAEKAGVLDPSEFWSGRVSALRFALELFQESREDSRAREGGKSAPVDGSTIA